MKKISPADVVIDAFGGVRPLARALGIDPSTPCKWRTQSNGNIPSWVQLKVLQLSSELKLNLTPDDVVVGRIIKSRVYGRKP